MANHLHRGDLPDGLDFGPVVAVDSETMGLNLHRDRLCAVQLSAGDGDAHVVHFPDGDYAAPRLKALLGDPRVTKIFHFARFDLVMLKRWLEVEATPVVCTKIASRLCRTNTDKHGLKDLSRDLLGIEMSKEQQTSDWGAADLSDAQVAYAAADVLHLHELKAKLDALLLREGRLDMARSLWTFLPRRADLDLAGFEDEDLFAHR